MSFSDDHASPAAPFSGDNTGDIFNAPDVVLNSPTTVERVVDTQSGFLVVVRRLEEKQALMVRRRLGTPPSSSIVLTPDESLKLSRILAGSSSASEPKSLTPAGDGWLDEFNEIAQRRGVAKFAEELSPKRTSHAAVKLNVWSFALVGVGIALLGLAGLMGYSLANSKNPAPKAAVAAPKPLDPLSSKRVDAFARKFVAEMLDFNADSYRVSRIRAMAAMAPELVDTYWTDTNFPLSKRQLSALPHDTTLMITKVNQQRIDPTQATADVYAQMVQGDSKIGTPVHLQLKLSLDAGEIRVLEQKDISSDK